MPVHIRLKRIGAKKRPYYRIVAADSRRARDGRFLEAVGTYNPITKPAEIKIAEDRLSEWLDNGAVPSDTVKSLLTQIGFIEKYHKAKKGEDVSEIALKTQIKERKKKTKKLRKAATVAEENAEEAEAPAEEKAEATEAPAEEPKAEEKAEETPAESSEEKPAE